MQRIFNYIFLFAFLLQVMCSNFTAFMGSEHKDILSSTKFFSKEFSASREKNESPFYELFEEEIEEEEEEEEDNEFDDNNYPISPNGNSFILENKSYHRSGYTSINALQNRKLYIYFSCLKTHFI